MKRIFYLLVLVMGMISASCSNDNKEDGISNSYAPDMSQTVAKEFRFYINPPKWAFKCLPSDIPGEGLVLVATDAVLYEPAVWYNRTAENMAHITISFTDSFNGRGYYYDYDLVFTDAHQGKFSGYCKTSQWDVILMKEVQKTEKQSGYFAYDMVQDPDFDSIDDLEEDDDELEVDWGYLHNSWFSQQSNVSQYLTLNKDDSYLLVQTDGGTKYQEEKGFYLVDKENLCISMLAAGEKTADTFKIIFLDSEELELRKVYDDNSLGQSIIFSISDMDGTEYNPGSGGNNDKPEAGNTDNIFDIKISHIEDYSAYFYISYKNPGNYINSSDYLAAGVCYGKSPHPTIYDASTEREIVNPKTIYGRSLPDLERNTTYYIRPYTLKNGVPTYHTETSFMTQGGNSVYVSLSHVQGNTVRYNYSINMEGTFKIVIRYINPINGKNVKVLDLGIHKKGDSDYGNCSYTGEWESRGYMEITAESISNGYDYRDSVYK